MKENIIDYRCLSNKTSKGLTEEVSELISSKKIRGNQEWRPAGGVSVAHAGIAKQGSTGIKTSTVYSQAMILVERD